MVFLITGVAGFIGARTAELLLIEKHEVIGIDNLNNYYDVKIKEYRLSILAQFDNFKFIKGDIEIQDTLEKIFKENRIDKVINLAARAGVRYSLENPFIYAQTNLIGSLNLLDLMRKYGVKKYIMASTSSIYAGSKMPYKEDLAVNNPISPYAASKKSAELMAYTYHHQFNIDITILRYFTVFGPAGRPDMSILRFIKWIYEEKPILLFGDGTQARDFTYIDDIARGTINAAFTNTGFEIINLGGGNKPVSLLQLISKIEMILNKKAIINHEPFHAADVDCTMADISKASKILDWRPKVSLDDGILSTVKWYLENKDWLSKIDFHDK